ncbi:MAG TPA: hypothetical protein VKS20_09170 [Candidatus Acidoferrales bacterium]|nr:hypothetical protein [Candidatus Acidoferrales bacterium]
MEGLDEFHQSRAVIEDFAANTLGRIPGDVSRLLHVAMLRDLASGRYRHDGLAALYSEPVVDEALRLCHEQLFERLLETSLESQDAEVRKCLQSFDVELNEIAARWKEHEFYKCLIPSGVPIYLRELFCSNFGTVLGLIVEQSVTRRSVA